MTIPLHDFVTDDGRVFDLKVYPENTGYNVRAGSQELAYRRAQNAMDDDTRMVAASYARLHRGGLITRRARVAMLARLALDILATPTPRGGLTRKPW